MAMLLLITFSCKPKSEKSDMSVLSKNIEYDVTINNFVESPCTSLEETNSNWYHNNIEASVRGAFLDLLFKNALSGKLNITDMNNKVIDTNKLKELLTITDTITSMQDRPPFKTYDTIIKTMLSPSMITTLRFRENWTYEPKTMAITKKVIAIAPLASSIRIDKEGKEIIGKKNALFWIVLPEKNSTSKVLTKRIVSTVSYTKDPIYNSLNFDSTAIGTYMQKLLQLVYADSLTAYQLSSGELPDVAMSGKEWEKQLCATETIKQQRTTPPYDTYDTIVKKVFTVSAIRFLEEWKFDPETMAIDKKIVGVCPVEECFDMNKEFKGYRPLFWVYFSDVWTPFDGKLELKKKNK